jgi:hypothetical protein
MTSSLCRQYIAAFSDRSVRVLITDEFANNWSAARESLYAVWITQAYEGHLFTSLWVFLLLTCLQRIGKYM